MKRVLKILTNWWVLSISAAAAAALLLMFVLPLVAHGLRPWPWRLTLALVVAAVWGAAALARFLLQRRAAARLARALDEEAASASAEGAVLTGRMKEAVAKLKADSGGRRNYLYSRPWYVIIGAPGSGKTTALLNSGLRFPFSDTALKGVGGTRNLDFWFADEAVLVDTAGRYTSQDSHEARDKEGWTRFLSLLRANRPLQPINGVFVAISLDSVASADRVALDQQADTIRRRLKELRDGLQTLAPVYVIFTKSDLIAGFREYYDDLDVEGRRSVLGATLPLAGRKDGRTVAVAFDEVAQAVADRVSGRIQAELDPRRRGLIIGFPAQLECLRDPIVRLLTGAFPADAAEQAADLRGFYFTSGVQEGTPFDALLGSTAALAEVEPDARGRGRAYFINRLLNEVVFREAGLARPTPEARAKDARLITAAYAGVAAVAALMVLAWTASFIANLGYQKKVIAAAEALQPSLQGLDMRQVSAADPGLADVQPVLDALRGLPGGYDDRRAKGFPKFPLGLGLHDDGLSRDVEEAYLDGVQRIMLPRLMLRMEDFLRANQEAPVELYSGLRAYRLLSGDAPAKIHKRDIGSVAEWVTADWTRYSLAGGDMTTARASLTRHLKALLEEPEIGRVWGDGRQAPYDPALVRATQTVLQVKLTAGQRGYAILRDLPTDGRPWRPNLPADKLRAFANPAQVQALTVPYLFTREGYFKQYQVSLPKVIEQLASEGWVLGEQASIPLTARAGLAGEIGQAYAAEYSRRWGEVLAALTPGDYIGDDAAAQALFSPPSPLGAILDQVKRETNLTLPGNRKMPSFGGLDAGARITADFASLSTFDANAFVTLVKQVKEASMRPASDPMAAAALQEASIKLKSMALSIPAGGFGTFVSQTAGQVTDAGVGVSAEALKQEYLQSILPVCQRVTGQAYPFVRSSTTDASRRDVAAFFGPGQLLDQFVKGKLAGHINSTGPFWSWTLNDPVSQRFVSSPQRFQEAQDLQVLMSDGLDMQITALSFSPGVEAVEVRIGSATQVFTRGDTRPIGFRWTPNDNPTAMVTFVGTSDYLNGTGEWALFRLFGPPTQMVNTGDALKVTFAKGSSSATFRVVLPRTMKNPFRDGPWGFRCPAEL